MLGIKMTSEEYIFFDRTLKLSKEDWMKIKNAVASRGKTIEDHHIKNEYERLLLKLKEIIDIL